VVRPIRFRSIPGALVAGAVTALLLTACAQEAPQSKEHSSTEGIDATLHDIGIRNAFITLNADGTGVLNIALFNQGDQSDQLTGVTPGSATAFKSAVLPTDAQVSAASDNGGAASSSSDTTSATGTGVALPTDGGVFLDQPPAEIALAGLAAGTLVGQSIPVTLTFANAGTITLQVPIGGGANVSASAGDTSSPSDSPTATTSSSTS
jgi:copper(I)-binding protein